MLKPAAGLLLLAAELLFTAMPWPLQEVLNAK